MRRLLIGLLSVAILLAFSGETMAVDKKTKKDPKKDQVVTQKKVPAKTPTVKTPAKTPAKTPGKPPKKYDDFIDKNNNGIDDRKEKLVPKAAKDDKTKKTKKKK